jgi:hypothetical protein
MFFLIPMLATLGGGSALAGAAIAATAIAGVASAVGTYQAGSAAASAEKQAAKQEALKAQTAEIERKRNLLRALGNQNAVAGAQGVAFSGGKEAIARKDILEAREDSMIAKANLDTSVAASRSRASNFKKQGALGAGVSLLDTAGKVGQLSA